ncbi:glycosyl hydrolase family 38 domain-containing protein [Colletotrichum cuscutae]|uniref:Glycosyl hydrolase family 38 domain-containing protein n=1 Tax=Colletotrichum cuscutae TaxID=1209917 RepID=A0AAJ0DNY4_9PEZI|nr:glycosyl hydrolase family 38 domain-containing protein [Colletotrichum cuscutae]
MCGLDGHGGSGSSTYPLRAPVPVGKRANKLYRDRTANFYSPGQWEKVNLLSPLRPLSHRPLSDAFGPSWSTHWFRVRVTTPEDMRQMDHLELHWDCSNEATVWTSTGEPLQGLTGRGERIEWILPQEFKDGEEHVFYLEMACNGMLTNAAGEPIFKNNANGDAIQPPDPNKIFTLTKAEIVGVDLQARALHADITVIHQAAEEFPEDSWEQHEALSVATRIINTFRVGDRASIVASRKIAEEYLGPDVDSAKVFDVGSAGKGASVYAIGHCHIDTCWLWPWEETKRKVARSWLNQCDLMDRYPELNFACSQAQQFKWLKQFYPHAWTRVKSKVAAGQFHPIGGCWVEHDTNIPSGESLIRQFHWPALLREVALDGSQVICHMPPAKTYCANATFGDVKRIMTQHKSLDQDHTSLLVVSPILPKIIILDRRAPSHSNHSTPHDFFDRLEKKAQTFPTWHGELYFELHRGVYTTQAQTKLNNRKAEILLRDVELLATIASVEDRGYRYPKKELDEMWEGVLLCQFHDCLPGTAIGMCYDDSDKIDDISETPTESERLVALNTLGWPRKEVLTTNGKDFIATREITQPETTKPLVTVQEVSEGIFVLENSHSTVTVESGTITSLLDRRAANREVLAPGSGRATQFVIFDDKPIYWQAWDVEVFHLETREEVRGGRTSVLEASPLRSCCGG